MSAPPAPADLYHPVLLRHARAPTRRGRVAAPTHEVDGRNRPCGDYLVLTLASDGAIVTAARFDGEGCALSQAAASALCDAIEGQSLEGARARAQALVAAMRADPGGDRPPDLDGDLAVFAPARAFPGRHGCVTLAADLVLRALGPTPA